MLTSFFFIRNKVRASRPIFGNSLDRELGSILKIMLLSRGQIDEVEAHRKIYKVMRILRQYLLEKKFSKVTRFARSHPRYVSRPLGSDCNFFRESESANRRRRSHGKRRCHEITQARFWYNKKK